MGKKKTQKTKQIAAVAIPETETSTSKLDDDGGGQLIQPRKRGRPRKLPDEPQNQQKNDKLPPPPTEVAEKLPPEKKPKTNVDDPPPPSMEGAPTQQPKSGDDSRTSRGRRKNKPRKSS